MKLLQYVINGIHYNRLGAATLGSAIVLHNVTSVPPTLGGFVVSVLLGSALAQLIIKGNQHHELQRRASEHLDDCDKQVKEMRAQLKEVLDDYKALEQRLDNLPASKRKPRPVVWPVVVDGERIDLPFPRYENVSAVVSPMLDVPVMRWDRVSRAQRKAFHEARR